MECWGSLWFQNFLQLAPLVIFLSACTGTGYSVSKSNASGSNLSSQSSGSPQADASPLTTAPAASAVPNTNSSKVASNAFSIAQTLVAGTVSGNLPVGGVAGSQWLNIAAFSMNSGNINWSSQLSSNVAPVNGTFQLNIDTSSLPSGNNSIAIVAFTSPAGQSGGTYSVLTLSLNISTITTPTPTPVPTPAPAPTPTPPFIGYVLKFDDEFTSFVGNANGTNGWMTKYPDGNRTNNPGSEAECYVDPSVIPNFSPFSLVSNGLEISATSASSTGTNPCGLPYNSGLIASSTTFFMQYGYFEINAQMPSGPGLWPAFWLLPTDVNLWPPEIDAIEWIGNPNQYHAGLFWGTNSTEGDYISVTPNLTTSFHTYAVDWEPDTMTYYFDGKKVLSYPTPAGMNLPMYMIANLAVGTPGSWPGAPSNNIPAKFVIRYIRAWASPKSTNIGGSRVK